MIKDEHKDPSKPQSRWNLYNFGCWGIGLLVIVIFAAQLARLPREGWIIGGVLVFLAVLGSWVNTEPETRIKKCASWLFIIPMGLLFLAFVIYAVYMLGVELPIKFFKNINSIAHDIGMFIIGLVGCVIIYAGAMLLWHLVMHRRGRYSFDCFICKGPR